MSQPSYYSSGTTPKPGDTRLVRWTKILGWWQNLDGADAANDPKRGDTLRRIMEKLAKAVKQQT